MRILFSYRGNENLGIESISACLKAAGHTTDLLFDPGFDDTFYFKFPLFKRLKIEDKLIRKAKRFAPDLIAYSGVTNMYPYIQSLASRLKKELDVPTIVGGIHATADPRNILAKDFFDMACKGEGEETMVELVQHLEQDKDVSAVRNLVLKKNNTIIENPIRPPLMDLDQLPFLDKDLFYKYGVFKHRLLTMMTRGCSFKCTFCVNSTKGTPPYRVKSPQRAIDELEHYKERYHPRMILFEDDLFPYNSQWLQEFVPAYKERIGLPFYCNVHPLTVNEENITLMKEAGCLSLGMGVQSGDETLRIKLFERYGTDEQIKKAATLIRQAGIDLRTEFIFGTPTETPQQMWDSVELNYLLKPDNTSSFLLYPFPGTKFFDYAKENKLLKEEEIKKIQNGDGSYHTSLLFDTPYSEDAKKFNALLPIFAQLPASWKPLFRALIKKRYGALHKIIYYGSIPFIYPIEFKNTLKNYPRLLYYSMKELNTISS